MNQRYKYTSVNHMLGRCFVKYDGKWERRDIELGLSDGINVEVLSGLSESDEIKLWNQPVKG